MNYSTEGSGDVQAEEAPANAQSFYLRQSPPSNEHVVVLHPMSQYPSPRQSVTPAGLVFPIHMVFEKFHGILEAHVLEHWLWHETNHFASITTLPLILILPLAHTGLCPRRSKVSLRPL